MSVAMLATLIQRVPASWPWQTLWTTCGLVLGLSGQNAQTNRTGLPQGLLLLLVTRMEEVQVPHRVVEPRQGHQEVNRHRQEVVEALEGVRVADPVVAHLGPAAVREEQMRHKLHGVGLQG